jgi:deoxycytidylate deaminase
MVPTTIVNRAIKAAKYSTHRFRVGAVVYRNSQHWSSGYNQASKTHPRSPHPFRSIHAEFDAVLNMVSSNDSWWNDELSDCSIYVHRLKRNGESGLAKPCQWCQKMLDMVGIKEIYYSEG